MGLQKTPGQPVVLPGGPAEVADSPFQVPDPVGRLHQGLQGVAEAGSGVDQVQQIVHIVGAGRLHIFADNGGVGNNPFHLGTDGLSRFAFRSEGLGTGIFRSSLLPTPNSMYRLASAQWQAPLMPVA